VCFALRVAAEPGAVEVESEPAIRVAAAERGAEVAAGAGQLPLEALVGNRAFGRLLARADTWPSACRQTILPPTGNRAVARMLAGVCPQPAARRLDRDGAVADIGLTWPSLVGQALSADQQAALKAVVAARNALADRSDLWNTAGGGFQYLAAGKGGAPPGAERKVGLALKEFYSGEGGVSAVVTYDGTLSLGPGYADGAASAWVRNWFKADPTAETPFLRAGGTVSADGTGFVAIDNGDPPKVVAGEEARQVLRASRRWLSLFMTVAESAAHIGAAEAAQIAGVQSKLNAVPKSLRDAMDGWGDAAIASTLHLQWWLPVAGPVGHADAYRGTGGDGLAIAKLFATLLGQANMRRLTPAGARASGAFVIGATGTTAGVMTHYFDQFGIAAGAGGAGYLRRAVESGATKFTMSVNDVLASAAYDDHVILVGEGASGNPPAKDKPVVLWDLGMWRTTMPPAPTAADLAADAAAMTAAVSGAVQGGAQSLGGSTVARAVDHPGRRAELALARQALATQSTTPVATWAAAQDDWGVLEDSRTLVEQAPAGGSVTLLGNHPITIVVDDAGLAAARSAIRHRLLEILYDWRKDLDAELAGTHSVGSRLDVQNRIGRWVGPLYQAIRRGKPSDQVLEYPKDAPNASAIINAALSTAQLMGELAAQRALEEQDNNPGKAHSDAMAATGLGSGDEWCGAFASTQLSQGGLSLPGASVLPNPLLGTAPPAAGNLDGFFLYMPRLEIKVGEDWIDVEGYHAQRGSKRRYQVLPGSGSQWDADTARFQAKGPRLGLIASVGDLDARPGDIVLIDNQKGTYADHITLCRTYDASNHTLWTIGGNEGAAHPVHGSDAWNLDSNPAPAQGAFGAKPSRVYAVAGFSAVDFESHIYRRPRA
jgi:hypothetical protein